MFGQVNPDTTCSCGLPAVVVGSHLKNSSFVLTFLKKGSLNLDPIDTQDPWDTSCQTPNSVHEAPFIKHPQLSSFQKEKWKKKIQIITIWWCNADEITPINTYACRHRHRLKATQLHSCFAFLLMLSEQEFGRVSISVFLCTPLRNILRVFNLTLHVLWGVVWQSENHIWVMKGQLVGRQKRSYVCVKRYGCYCANLACRIIYIVCCLMNACLSVCSMTQKSQQEFLYYAGHPYSCP